MKFSCKEYPVDRAAKLPTELGISSAALPAVAILAGNDYDTAGLKGVGVMKAITWAQTGRLAEDRLNFALRSGLDHDRVGETKVEKRDAVVGGKAVKKGGAESFPFAHLARSGTPPGHPNKYQYRVGMDQVDRHHSFLAALGSISPSSSASHGSTASCSTSPRMIKSEDVGTGPIRTTKTTPQGILKPYTRPNGPWTPEPTQ